MRTAGEIIEEILERDGVSQSDLAEMMDTDRRAIYQTLRKCQDIKYSKFEEMLDKLADYYEEEVEMAVATMMAAMEPLIIVVLAVIVLVLISACMAPMLTMYEALDSM